MKHDHAPFEWKELGISLVLLVLLLFVLNPGHIWMPTMAHMSFVLGFLIVFCIFAVFVWREKARDEREQAHRMIAGRFAFLIGAAVLAIGLVFQNIQEQVDPWLVVALGSMVLAKTIGVAWANKRK